MDIIGLSSTTVIWWAWKSVEFGEKTQNKGYAVKMKLINKEVSK